MDRFASIFTLKFTIHSSPLFSLATKEQTVTGLVMGVRLHGEVYSSVYCHSATQSSQSNPPQKHIHWLKVGK
uniref:Uncharacterized protein n=1 Tax=Anguilla anguilla TaxID=7936 RepID=A0A0E9WFX3_ANGAN